MFQTLHFTPKIPAHFTKCGEAYFVCVCVCDWGREWVCACLLGADGWPSVEGRVGGGLLLLWQVIVDPRWIQMRRSPSLFHSILPSCASTPTCTNTGSYGHAPLTCAHSCIYDHAEIQPSSAGPYTYTNTKLAAFQRWDPWLLPEIPSQ